ncbi:MAG: type IV secretory system conjugative DNA transfer family protein [Henriciella sp.]|nr:type IV secretory system conjugative DNA transfer family protein [Henriciella sp.]
MSGKTERQGRLLPSLVIGGAAYWVYSKTGPAMIGAEFILVPSLALGMCTIALFSGLAQITKGFGDLFEWLSAQQTTGLKGTAGLVKALRELGDDYEPKKLGPYWGAFEEKPGRYTEIISQIEGSAMVCGTSSSGKSSSIVIPTILTIPSSKLVLDFKSGNLACQLAEPLRREGETVRILNFANANIDILGESDCYNPAHIITDCFRRKDGILEVFELLEEEAEQIYPEPAESNSGQTDNTYFRNGSRFLISWTNLTTRLIDGETATMGDSATMLMDRDSMLRHALWGCGRLPTSEDPEHPEYASMPLEECEWAKNDLHDPQDVIDFISRYRAMCARVVKLLTDTDSRTADPFLEGAQQMMISKFGIATRSNKITNKSTFRFSDQKEGKRPTTVFLVVDPNTLKAQGPLISHIQWCAMQEWKRHPNKHRPTYLIADECANFLIHDLGKLLTFARAYCRMILFLQNFSSFRDAYSQEILSTLLSEAEIQLYLPGTREKEVLEYVVSKMGETSVMTRGKRGDRANGGLSIDGVDYREEGRPLMTADELRRTDDAVLFIRRNMAALVSVIPYAAIDAFRLIVGIDPFHGKKWLLPTQLRFTRDLRRRPYE